MKSTGVGKFGLAILAVRSRAVISVCQWLVGWWIGKRRRWTADTRRYGAASGYEVRYGDRAYWWDGQSLTRIDES